MTHIILTLPGTWGILVEKIDACATEWSNYPGKKERKKDFPADPAMIPALGSTRSYGKDIRFSGQSSNDSGGISQNLHLHSVIADYDYTNLLPVVTFYRSTISLLFALNTIRVFPMPNDPFSPP
jgi:hypothetical protein